MESFLSSIPRSVLIGAGILGASAVLSKCMPDNPCIPVIRIDGTIESGSNADISIASMVKIIRTAFDTPGAKAVVLLINSPGGSPVQAEHIYTHIRAESARTDLPVLAFIEDIAASGGYLVACAADTIIASPNSIVGSIGVISAGFGLHNLMENLGIERRVFTAGTSKAMMDPFQPLKEDDVKIMTDLQKDVYTWFCELVKERRNLSEPDATLFSGAVWSGAKAKELGLVDTHGELYTYVRNMYGKDIKIKMMEQKKSMFDKLFKMIGVEAAVSSAISSLIKAATIHTLKL